MPTYRNDSDKKVYVNDLAYIHPGASYETTFVLDLNDYPELTKTSDSPYYNPMSNRTALNASAGGSQTISINSETKDIQLVNQSSASIDVYINNLLNTPALLLLPSSIIDLQSIKRKIDTLIFSHTDAIADNEVNIIEYK